MKHPYRYNQHIIDLSRVTAVYRAYNGIRFTLDVGNEVVWSFDSTSEFNEMIKVYDDVGDRIMQLAELEG